MARTKNTTKKCTGGSVPHVLLKISRVQLSGGDHQKMKALSATRGALPVGGGDLEKRNGQHEALTATSKDLEMRSAHNEYYILCRDGAGCYGDNTLFMCTLCPRVICRLCLQLLPDIETKILQEDVSFRCICCHIKMEQSAAYFSFYNSNGLPFLDKFLSVNDALEVSAQAEISAAPVIFIHLILVDFKVAASLSLTTPAMLISFTERVLIGLCPLRLAFKDMLLQSWDLGSHSDIFLLTTVKEGGLSISRFAWANVEVHPWGNPLPI
ncbi:uncharacterized protein HD556DRAFT_1446603 [Suillus plorans]|uniref:Uncharacterized protein n=1 Tax=Suillus plorans TaxID=116603 RepID=A0A9P7DE51_9AGAM|nr:uncharacterized protein HD556DRAFT_1446603 [Suillus plorans]KAG1789808.1 hypothetical protein HD556DRAFT_1446603 [Suillus plorans]